MSSACARTKSFEPLYLGGLASAVTLAEALDAAGVDAGGATVELDTVDGASAGAGAGAGA